MQWVMITLVEQVHVKILSKEQIVKWGFCQKTACRALNNLFSLSLKQHSVSLDNIGEREIFRAEEKQLINYEGPNNLIYFWK